MGIGIEGGFNFETGRVFGPMSPRRGTWVKPETDSGIMYWYSLTLRDGTVLETTDIMPPDQLQECMSGAGSSYPLALGDIIVDSALIAWVRWKE